MKFIFKIELLALAIFAITTFFAFLLTQDGEKKIETHNADAREFCNYFSIECNNEDSYYLDELSYIKYMTKEDRNIQLYCILPYYSSEADLEEFYKSIESNLEYINTVKFRTFDSENLIYIRRKDSDHLIIIRGAHFLDAGCFKLGASNFKIKIRYWKYSGKVECSKSSDGKFCMTMSTLVDRKSGL